MMAAKKSSDAPPTAEPQILLFSPREHVRNVVLAGLLQFGYRVCEASNPFIAVMKIPRMRPSLVIVDITHDNAKGFLIIAALIRSGLHTTTPAIVAVPPEPADLLGSLSAEYLGPGHSDLPKTIHPLRYPFAFVELLGAVRNCMDSRASR
jgi:CheY-like chemotaxis protein